MFKSDGKQKSKRTIQIADDTDTQIAVTLWGEAATGETIKEQFGVGKLIALKNCRVSQYMGVSLNQSGDPKDICFKLNHPRTHELKQWFG